MRYNICVLWKCETFIQDKFLSPEILASKTKKCIEVFKQRGDEKLLEVTENITSGNTWIIGRNCRISKFVRILETLKFEVRLHLGP